MIKRLSIFSKDSGDWFEKKANLLLWISIGVYCLVFIGASLGKYYQFGYNALDLAIYNQVFYNTSLGNLFSFTIHPHSYLGDHLELFILLLVPFYSLFRHPATLLILQTLVIGFSAWPLYLIVKKLSSKKLALFLGIVFLFNPFVQNINLFEFHLLPFAIFFIFWTFYFYLSHRFSLFLIFSLLALLVREDVALVIIMFSVLSFFEKRAKKWLIVPFLIGLGWLAITFVLIPLFSHYQSYKFLFYYSWLGDSLGSIILNFFLHPLKVFSHLFSIQNISFILALFLPFLLLPFLKPKYLVLALLVFFQIMLGSFSGELVLKTHYCSLFLPSIFLTTASAFAFLLKEKIKGRFRWQSKIKTLIQKELTVFFIIFSAVTLYATFTFGPLLPLLKNVFFLEKNLEFTSLKNNYLNFLPEESSVTTSYEFLPKLSGRKNIFSLHYAFVGKKQYSLEPYELPDTDFLLLDANDFLIYQVQYPSNSFYPDAYVKGDDRIRSIIKEQDLRLIKASDTILLFQKEKEDNLFLYQILSEPPSLQHPKEIKVSPEIKFLGWNSEGTSENNHPTFQLPLTSFPISLYWLAQTTPSENFQLSLEIKNQNNQIVYQKYYPLGYGIYPTSEWQPEKIVQTNYWFLIPNSFINQNNTVLLKLVRLKKDHSFLGLDSLLSATLKNVAYEPVGKEIEIPFRDQ